MWASRETFPELRPFYALTELGLGMTWLAFALTGSAALEPHGLWARWLGGAGMLLALLAASLAAYRLRRRSVARLELFAHDAESRRLSAALAEWRQLLSANIGALPASVFVVPGADSIMWSDQGAGAARVFVSQGYWARRAKEDWQAGLLHEAGHVCAGDIATFHRLLAARGATLLVAPAALGLIGLRYVFGLRASLDDFASVVVVLFAAVLGLLSAWSALVGARELQADWFAAKRCNDGERVKRFLLARGPGTGSVLERAWAFVIQPARRFRATLPAARGQYGARIELCFGFALGGLFNALFWAGELLNAQLRREGRLGMCLPLALLPVIYVFAWWSARRRPGASGLLRHFAAGARLIVPAVSIVGLAGWLHASVSAAAGSLDKVGGSAGFVLSLSGTVFVGMVAVWSIATLALVVDSRRRTPSPHWLSALGASVLAACFTGVSVAVVAVVLPDHVGQLELVVSALVSSLLTLLLLACVAHLLARTANAREH